MSLFQGIQPSKNTNKKYIVSLSSIEEFAYLGSLLVNAVGCERAQVLCPRHPAGMGCDYHHLAQGVGSHAGLPNNVI